MSPRVMGLIPARGGSKGIPRKNMALLAGRPLIAYTFEATIGSARLDRVILSTDDDEIGAMGRAAGVEVPFRRPTELAGDAATIEAVVTHALNWLEDREGYRPDAFMILQPTSPLRRARHIDEAVEILRAKGADAVVSVSLPLEHPADTVYFREGRMHFLLPMAHEGAGMRQAYPECYFVNGAIYLTDVAAFLRTGSRFGQTTVPYLMSAEESIDVDTDAHLAIAEALLLRRAAAASS